MNSICRNSWSLISAMATARSSTAVSWKCADICQQIRAGSTAIAGIMAESFLQEGTQKVVPGQPLTWGQSITDPCLSWEDSERLLSELAAATATRL